MRRTGRRKPNVTYFGIAGGPDNKLFGSRSDKNCDRKRHVAWILETRPSRKFEEEEKKMDHETHETHEKRDRERPRLNHTFLQRTERVIALMRREEESGEMDGDHEYHE